MKIPHEKIKERGRKLIVESGIVGAVPFIGGVALSDLVLKESLPSLIRVGLVLGSGIVAHRAAGTYFETELYLAENGPPLGFRRSVDTLAAQETHSDI